MEETAQLIGIDVGGTFTDFVWLVDGQIRVHKESTTPGDQSEAILRGLSMLGVSADAEVVHGTTVATNALLERRGARTALLTTKGFRDVLAIGRQNRPHLYKLGQQRPEHLVTKELRFEAEGRIDAGGKELQPIDKDEIKALASALRELEIESLAIVFLFSFLNTRHEAEAARIIREELGDVFLSVSSELLPEYREFERTSTTVINAYVQPLVARYLSRLQKSLGKRQVRVMQSSGGAISLQKASEQAARLVLSGPAGGIVGAFNVARQALNSPKPLIMTFDMGGTSTDVALCPGELPRTSESAISGLPLRFPSTDIHTVGAGGGSIARVDAAGVLRVGPESAGAVPGPACYDRGGNEATVTDANLVLGRLNADGFLGGNDAVNLNKEKAATVLKKIGDALGVSKEEAALGVLRVANATMERALRKVSVEKGFDPRDYTLIPFGGAGPLHACALAEALDMKQILVPEHPGVLSALGLTAADITLETSISVLRDQADAADFLEQLALHFESLRSQIVAGLSTQSNQSEPEIEAMLDVRYEGQSYELEIPLHLPLNDKALAACAETFHQLHEQRYGYSVQERSVEFVTLRVRGRLANTTSTGGVKREIKEEKSSKIEAGQTRIWFEKEQPVEVPCYDRASLPVGFKLKGPCLVLQYDTTLVISGSWEGEVDLHKNINLWRTEGGVFG